MGDMDMETLLQFWLPAAVIVGATATALGLPLKRKLRAASRSARRNDIGVYRDQLKELDRDQDRGVLSAQEAESARIEISRRLLEADRKSGETAVVRALPSGPWLAGGLGLLVILGGFGMYALIGARAYPDLPLSLRLQVAMQAMQDRPGQQEAEALAPPVEGPEAEPQVLELMEKLRAAVAQRPDDLEGHMLLARYEASLGNFAASQRAMVDVVRIKGAGATSQDYADLAEMMILATAGYVSPQAEEALTRALQIAPENEIARYYLGLMYAQNDRSDLAFRLWRELLENSNPDGPWQKPIRDQILMVAAEAGVAYDLPRPALKGPSSEDIQAAGDMTEQDRMDMIRGMVEQLGERLASEGGTADEWARLVRALGVLGDAERAKAVWNEAQTVFADVPGDIERIRAAAREAGVAE